MQVPFHKALKIRIGINSGPVSAGVIGKEKFIYDLWGDTVNVASRMESFGSNDKIHISKSTYSISCGKRTGSSSMDKGTMPHTEQWIMGIGVPQ